MKFTRIGLFVQVGAQKTTQASRCHILVSMPNLRGIRTIKTCRILMFMWSSGALTGPAHFKSCLPPWTHAARRSASKIARLPQTVYTMYEKRVPRADLTSLEEYLGDPREVTCTFVISYVCPIWVLQVHLPSLGLPRIRNRQQGTLWAPSPPHLIAIRARRKRQQ